MEQTANREIFSLRHQRIAALLKKESCDALIIEDQINLYYLTGLIFSAGKLLLQPQGGHLIVDGRYFEMAEKKSPYPVVLAKKNALVDLLQSLSIKSLGINSKHMTYSDFIQLENEIKESSVSLLPLENPIENLRMIKDPEEILLLKEASSLGLEGFDFVVSLLKEGISEIEIAVELEIFWKRRGGQKVAFDPIIAFGPNSSFPHWRASSAKLEPNRSVLIDIGVNYEHYHSDMTRVVYFGEPDPKMLTIHEIVQEASNRALKSLKPGVSIADVDRSARDFIASKGYGEAFPHSLGHGIGLDIHEAPTLRAHDNQVDSLQKGMVVTIEPGIYVPEVGGVRIEDTVVITESGHENLTNRPKEPVIIPLK